MDFWQENQKPLELWGGVECTINRVADDYFEQLMRTGHVSRISDFERFASLGIKALRHPLLWECEPSYASENDRWEWGRAAVTQMQALGIRPILGLLHHGSGPRSTNLLDPDFPQKLADYAGHVAARFPDVLDYTPVNEPLTTARFSALYGHWYPHGRDEHSFARALFNQCRAIVLAMDAIRRINPAARLIQTDDLGKVHSTPALVYQAEFENERRWSSFDLLCGKLDRHHRMWPHFLYAGINEFELQWFLDHPCPPDVLGLNHYLSGERFLDEHLDRYPADAHGGNAKYRYADVLAARVLRSGSSGPRNLLLECWERYKLPIAITECHNGCTREEQLRWFLEVWEATQQARLQRANVIAVTAWSLLGSFDWDTLVTRKNDRYEPGVYDVRSDPPRPTALAALVRNLASGNDSPVPVLQVPGWWHRPRRFVYGFSTDEQAKYEPAPAESINSAYAQVRPVVITDSESSLVRAIADACESRGIPYRILAPHLFLDADRLAVHRVFHELNPWAIINIPCDTGLNDSHAIRRSRNEGARRLARECAQRGVRFLGFSSDLVFNGEKGSPYVESDEVGPINTRGCSHAESETLVQSEMPAALIVRSGPLFGSWHSSNFLVRALCSLRSDERFAAADDLVVSPTYVPDLVHASLDLLIDGERGIWHLANQGQVSWADFAAMAAQLANISSANLRSYAAIELALHAALPKYSALTSERGILLPTLEDAVARFVRDYETLWHTFREKPEHLAA